MIETPPGLDNNRRQTRSVTRGTPAPAPKPAPAAKKERKTPAPKKARVEAKGKAEKMETSSGGDEIANAAEKVTEVKKDNKVHGAVVAKLKEAEEKKVEPIKPSQSISPEKPAAASPAKVETTPTAKVVEKKEVVADVAPALPIPAPVAASISPSLRSPSDKLGAKASEPSKPIVQNNNSSPEKQAIPAETVSTAAAATVAPTSNNVAPVAIANHDKVSPLKLCRCERLE